MFEKIVSQIIFDAAGDNDNRLAGQVEKHTAHRGDSNKHESIAQQCCGGKICLETVDGMANDDGGDDREYCRKKN